jgi:hypothetical protein
MRDLTTGYVRRFPAWPVIRHLGFHPLQAESDLRRRLGIAWFDGGLVWVVAAGAIVDYSLAIPGLDALAMCAEVPVLLLQRMTGAALQIGLVCLQLFAD